MTSQHGQHGKPAALKLYCLSGFCKILLVMDFGCTVYFELLPLFEVVDRLYDKVMSIFLKKIFIS